MFLTLREREINTGARMLSLPSNAKVYFHVLIQVALFLTRDTHCKYYIDNPFKNSKLNIFVVGKCGSAYSKWY